MFDNSPPGIYWLYRVVLWAGGGEHHVVVQLTAAAAVLAAAFLTVYLAARLLPSWAAWMAGFLVAFALSLPTLDGDVLNVELAALPFFLGALALVFLADKRPRSRLALLSWIAAGALAAAAILIRPTYGIEALVILALAMRSPRWKSRLVSLVAGLIAVLGAALFQLFLSGSLRAYVAVVMPTDHGYLLMSNDGSLLPLVARLAVLAGAAAYLYYRTRRGRWWWYSLWLPASIAAASVTPRELTHYVHEAIPALAIAVVGLASALWPRRGWLAAPAMLVALVAACEAVLIIPAQQTAIMTASRAPAPFLHNFSYPGLPRYYANWLAYLSGRESFESYERGFPVNLEQISAEAAVLRQVASPPSRLLVLGGPPDLYYRSQLLPAGPFLILNTSYLNAPGADAGTQAAITGHRADVVLLGSVPPWDPVDWAGLLANSGYRQVRSRPWPIYVDTY